MTTKKKLQVFISSTYRDLKAERQATVEAILKAGHIPAGMELFSAGSESQLETIRRWIDESDVYMLILGGRYGSVDPKTSLSYIELEYDYAVSNNKPLFSVVITEPALDQKIKVDGKEVMETENPKELKLFREKVLTRISSFFSDVKDIKLAVHETLADFQGRYKFAGWISGSELPNVASLLEEITKLRVERDDAITQLAEAKAAVDRQAARSTSKWRDDEFKELLSTLGKIEITTKAFSRDKTKPAITVTVLRIFDGKRDDLITGVTNRLGVDDEETLLFYNVCPKLEMHELAAVEKVAGMVWQRYRLTAKGKALLVYMDKNKPPAQAKPASETTSPTTQETAAPADPRKRVRRKDKPNA